MFECLDMVICMYLIKCIYCYLPINYKLRTIKLNLTWELCTNSKVWFEFVVNTQLKIPLSWMTRCYFTFKLVHFYFSVHVIFSLFFYLDQIKLSSRKLFFFFCFNVGCFFFQLDKCCGFDRWKSLIEIKSNSTVIHINLIDQNIESFRLFDTTNNTHIHITNGFHLNE